MKAWRQELHHQIVLPNRSEDAIVAKRQKEEAAFKARQRQQQRQEQKEERVRQQKAAAKQLPQVIPSPVVAMLIKRPIGARD